MERKTKTIGFRLPPLEMERLETLAASAGVSVHEYARILLLVALHPIANQELQSTKDQILELRKDCQVWFKSVLVLGGLNAEEADRFIKERTGT